MHLPPALIRVENRVHRQLIVASVPALRLAVGLVFLGFGVLKFFPNISPAQNLVEKTTSLLTFGLVPGGVAIVAVASLECFIGLCFLANRWMRLAIWLLAAEFVGILSPIVLLTGRLFSGPHNAPTLEGQYVLKDIILVAAGMVVAAASFRGGRLVRDEPSLAPPAPRHEDTSLTGHDKLAIVMAGARHDHTVSEVCDEHHIAEADFYRWRDTTLDAAALALDAGGVQPSPGSGARRQPVAAANGHGPSVSEP